MLLLYFSKFIKTWKSLCLIKLWDFEIEFLKSYYVARFPSATSKNFTLLKMEIIRQDTYRYTSKFLFS